MSGNETTDGPERLAEHYAHCESHLRAGDYDTWLALLFAPAEKRRHLHALHAFLLDVSTIRQRVTESLAGELRLQWWRDAVTGQARGDTEAHPIAAAFLDTVRLCRLPEDLLLDLIEAHRFDVYSDPMPTLLDWENYCEQTSAASLRLASIILTGKPEPAGLTACSHAGVARAVLRQFLDLAYDRSPVFIPEDLLLRHGVGPDDIEAGQLKAGIKESLADMRGIARLHLDAFGRHASSLEPAAMPAFLTTSLVEPTLRLTERKNFDPFTQPAMLPRWRRQWIMWRASRRGGI